MKRLGAYQDFAGGELRNWSFQKLSAAPSSPPVGTPYYNTGNNAVYVYNGTSWRPVDAALLTDGTIQNSALATNPLIRANHTGTQTASTISDLSTTVKGYTLDTFAAPAATLSLANQRLALVATATVGTDAVNLNQVNSLISAAIQGVNAVKTPVRVATTGNVTLSGLQTIDGVTVAAGDRILARAQTTASQNLIYVAASGAWSIAVDSDGAGELIEGTQVLVAEGTTYSGSIFRITTTGTITPNSTSITWTQAAQPGSYTADEATLHLTGSQFSARLAYGLTTVANGIQILTVSAGGLQVTSSGLSILLPASSGLVADSTGLHIDISSTIATARITQGTITGDGSTVSFTITHNLNTRRIMVQFQDSSYNVVDIDWTATNANSITVNPGLAIANGTTYSVTITG